MKWHEYLLECLLKSIHGKNFLSSTHITDPQNVRSIVLWILTPMMIKTESEHFEFTKTSMCAGDNKLPIVLYCRRLCFGVTNLCNMSTTSRKTHQLKMSYETLKKTDIFTFDWHNRTLCVLRSVSYWEETLQYLLIINCLT
jgi:hypothetical protein